MTYEYIDAARISRLSRELVGDLRTCLRFVDDFVASSTERIARVQRAVDHVGLDDALASLLSLATSSAMIGAVSLSAAARDLHTEAMRSGSIAAPEAERLVLINSASCAELIRFTAPWRVAA